MTVAPFARLAARTSPGSWRSNEDAFLLSLLDRRVALGCDDAPAVIGTAATTALGVYDGCGVYNDGDGATMSQLAAQTVHDFLTGADLRPGALGTSLVAALTAANHALYRKSRDEARYQGCRSLATVAAFDGTSLFTAHVGHGCALLLRKTGWCLLSRDQTLQAIAHQMGIEGADKLPPDVVVTSLGENTGVSHVASVAALRRGDRVLLCTGWLRRTLGLKWLVSTLRREQSPGEVCEALLRAAIEIPKPWNITLAVVDFISDELPEPSATDPAPLVVETSTALLVQEDPS